MSRKDPDVPPRILPEQVREIAQLARLRLTEAETQRFAGELDAILGYIDELRQLDLANVEPMTHAVPFDCPVREDVVGTMLPVDAALANAPAREEDFFQVPRMMPTPGAGGGAGQ